MTAHIYQDAMRDAIAAQGRADGTKHSLTHWVALAAWCDPDTAEWMYSLYASDDVPDHQRRELLKFGSLWEPFGEDD